VGAASPSPALAATGKSDETGTTPRAHVATGFVACGDEWCPTEPMCWRGPVQSGDV